MDSSNNEKCPSAPPAYFDQEAALNAFMISSMGKIQEYHTSDIESIQAQMKTTREAMDKTNIQIDAQDKTMREAMTKINMQIDAQEDNSKAITEIQMKLTTKGWKRFLLHLMFFILVNGIIDYVAYYYFCPWFGIYSSVNYGVIKDVVNLCIVVYLLVKY